MRIGICHKDITEITHGGVARLYKSLALSLRDLGEDVTVISSKEGWNPPGIQRVVLSPDPDKYIYSQLIAKCLPALNLDVVECSSWGFELLAYLKKAPRKMGVLVRGDLTAATLGATQYSCGEREILTMADAVVCVSNYASRDIQSQYAVNAPLVIHNGVDTNTFKLLSKSTRVISSGVRLIPGFGGKPLKEDPLTIPEGYLNVVWVGKPTKMKGFNYLQQVVEAAKDYPIRFYICLGHSQELVKLRILGNPNVIVLQDLSEEDYVALLNVADLYLSTSRWEGFGLSVLEAMACGCPIVFRKRCQVLTEFVRDGIDGRSVYTIKNCLEAIQSLSRTELEVSINARSQQFSWESNAKKTLEVYRRLVK